MAQTEHHREPPDTKMEPLDEDEMSCDDMSDDTTLKNASERVTGEVMSQATRKRATERKFICTTCGKGFLHSGHLKRHLKLHSKKDHFNSKKDSFHYGDLSEPLTVQSGLSVIEGASESVVVQPDLPIINGESPLSPASPVSGNFEPVRSRSELSLTELKQTINRSFVCEICGKGFGRNSHLKRHVKLHGSNNKGNSSDAPSDTMIIQAGSLKLRTRLKGGCQSLEEPTERANDIRTVLRADRQSEALMEQAIDISAGLRDSHCSSEALTERANNISFSTLPERRKSPVFIDPLETLVVKSEPPSVYESEDTLLVKSEPPCIPYAVGNVVVKTESDLSDSPEDMKEAESPHRSSSCWSEMSDVKSECSSFGETTTLSIKTEAVSIAGSGRKKVRDAEYGFTDSSGGFEENTRSSTSASSRTEVESDGEQHDGTTHALLQKMKLPSELIKRKPAININSNSASSQNHREDARIVNMMNQEGTKNLSCVICGKTFGRKSHLTRHVKLHTSLEFHDCEICGKRFLQASYLKAHINTVHATVKEELEKIFGCSICDKQFGRMSHLKRHMKLHIGGKTYDCKLCGKSFLQNSNLKSHEKSHADLMISIEEGLIKRHVNEETNTEYFDCEQCGKSFQQISSLKAHINTVHVGPKIFERCFECTYCGKQFGRNSHLKRHLKLHIGGETYSCDLCGRVFMQNGNLKAHIRMVHLKERSHQCTICGKMFLQQSNLNTHIRTHTGEKPYECTVCGRDFTQGNQLKYHMRTHFGETPFSCKICGKTFTNNRSCKRHMKTHTGEKPFECGICDKNFYQGNQLKAHMRTHTGEKPYACSICGKEFTNNRGRNRHVLAHSTNPDKWNAGERRRSRDSNEAGSRNDSEGSVGEVMSESDIKEEIEAVVKEEPEICDFESDFESTSESYPLSSNVSPTKGNISDEEELGGERDVIQSVNEAIKDMTKNKVRLSKQDDLPVGVVSNENVVVGNFDNGIQANQTDPNLLVEGMSTSMDVEEDPFADL